LDRYLSGEGKLYKDIVQLLAAGDYDVRFRPSQSSRRAPFKDHATILTLTLCLP
jgi:hypothetical protein